MRRVRGINWDEHWERRARSARRRPGIAPSNYSRDADPLFDFDLREVWPELTGFDLRGSATRCPNPDHDDRFASVAVHERLFNCHGCGAAGSIIDLGALLYGEQPRGAGFFRIRERLLADLGLDERRAA
jgi:hypothetical protein